MEVRAVRTLVEAPFAAASAAALVGLTLVTVRFSRTASGFTLIVPEAETEIYRSVAAALALLAILNEPSRASAIEVETIDFLVSFIVPVSHAFTDVYP